MERQLAECCEIAIRIFEKLLKEGKITKEEYDKQTLLKKKFLKKTSYHV